MNLPTISIITVAYNASNTIETTILSVVNQTYPNIEYIIIDGGSTDGTIDIIKKYENKITKWISEPDKGIYDAMNKGINLARGEWINFMNCGDSFYENNTLQVISDTIINSKDINVIYGNSIISLDRFKYIVLPKELENLSSHLPFCHQCSFVQTSLAKKYPFELKYKFVADYNFFYQLFLKKHIFLYINKPIAYYRIEDGFTASNMDLSHFETYKVNGKNISNLTKIQYKIKSLLLKYLPKCCIIQIRRITYNFLFTRIE